MISPEPKRAINESPDELYKDDKPVEYLKSFEKQVALFYFLIKQHIKKCKTDIKTPDHFIFFTLKYVLRKSSSSFP